MGWSSAGTVNVTSGTNNVVGTGTLFSINSRNGDAFAGPDGHWYEIINIVSDTQLTISPNYIGANATNAAYKIVPIQGYVKSSADLLREVTDDLTNRLDVIEGLDAAELAALEGIESNIQAQLDTKFTGDATYLAARENHTGEQAVSTITGLQDQLDSKQPLNSLLTGTTASFTTALKTKLDGIASSATANQTDVYLLSRVNHVGAQAIGTVTGLQDELDGKQPLSAVLTGTTESFTTVLKTKLDGIATGATANSTDIDLRDRSTHTGTQPTSSITGLDTALAGKQATLVSGTNIKTINGAPILGTGDITIDGDIIYNGIQTLNGKTGITVDLIPSDIGAATAAQGALADTAIQTVDLEDYVDTALTDYVTTTGLATAIATRASAAQGALADTALQPGAIEASAYIKRIRTLALAAI